MNAENSEKKLCIEYKFLNPSLLQDALTHPSLAGLKQGKKSKTTSYERLEFLGDRVLGLVIAEWLYKLFPDSSEGDLAKRLASLVNRDSLREIALAIGLDKHIKIARAEENLLTKKNQAVLSDAMEALIGAIYLDGGIEAARKFIHKHWKNAEKTEAAPADPKTALQEWVQGHGLPLPVYKVKEKTGPAHAPKFVVEASVSGFKPTIGEGPSKRLAEKEAAQKLLQLILEKGE